MIQRGLSIILSFVMVGIMLAQKPIYTKAKVNSVKVYRSSAELQNLVEVSLPAGISEIVVGNISDEIEEETMQVILQGKGVSVLSAQFTDDYSMDFQQDMKNPQMKVVSDSIKIVENLIVKSNIDLEANLKAIELLDKNQTVLVGSNSSSVAQLTQLTEFYTNKRIELSNKLENIKNQNKKLTDKLARLKSSLKTSEERELEEYANGVIVIKVLSNTAIKTKLNINYIANNVSWKPHYEVKGDNIYKPLEFSLKGVLVQNTGLDWKNVKITLIDGNSTKRNDIPVLTPWFLRSRQEESDKKILLMSAKERKDTTTKYIEEVVVSSFVSKANTLNTSYETDILYDIRSNGEEYLINLYQQKIPTEYKYYTIPYSQREAYLIGEIKDFGKYELISASANIVFENMYIGKTRIIPNETEDVLKIALGNDPKIGIKRENITEKSSEKTFSSYQEKVITYDLIIRNNKQEFIDIEVKDIIPISDNESIKIELLESSRADIDKERGFLTWKIKINPSETKKLRVSYKIRYPKDFIIDNL